MRWHPPSDDFIASIVGQGNPSLGADWTKLVQGKDLKNGVPSTKTYEPLDRRFSSASSPRPTSPAVTARAGIRSMRRWVKRVSRMRSSCGRCATPGPPRQHVLRRRRLPRLDTGERLLKLVGAASVADEVRSIRLNLRRVTAHKDDKKVLKAAVDNPESSGLKPWREVLPPHDDVATGNFAHPSSPDCTRWRSARAGRRLRRPRRVLQTDVSDRGSDRLDRSRVRRSPATTRAAGHQPADQLRWWQDSLDAGAVACRMWVPVGKFPQETQDLLTANGYAGTKVNRVRSSETTSARPAWSRTTAPG
ncbi:hypothetical protein BZL29_7686 [Mycobacterium kansasii]|uniref:Uncharacterized protein n=1 Tax=Mycobacterium kansasii TaxID=1768 RepID=A0A1V3WHC0_MYCKA|nr:hypothetical protein BZL29_7686 [Mycobacterium kansasii]